MNYSILLLLLAIPVGYTLAYLTKEELVAGRAWYKAIIGLSFFSALISLILGKQILVISFSFVSIVAFISLFKSYDKLFLKVRKNNA
jgi:hypothetical protein